MNRSPPPIYHPIIGGPKDPNATIPWIEWFNKTYVGDTGTEWTPTFTGLTQVGTPTITGRYYKLSNSLAFFAITIVPATSTTATAGTTYVNNFPLDITNDGACFTVSGLLGGPVGMVTASNNRIYPANWSAVTVPLTIVGLVEAR